MAVKNLVIPSNYENKLDIISTEVAIKYVKDLFERRLAHHLNLMRISAPLYVSKSSGLNDDLMGQSVLLASILWRFNMKITKLFTHSQSGNGWH